MELILCVNLVTLIIVKNVTHQPLIVLFAQTEEKMNQTVHVTMEHGIMLEPVLIVITLVPNVLTKILVQNVLILTEN
jgi:hypothetical protein